MLLVNVEMLQAHREKSIQFLKSEKAKTLVGRFFFFSTGLVVSDLHTEYACMLLYVPILRIKAVRQRPGCKNCN